MLIALDASTLDGIFEAVEANNHMNVFFWENDQLIYAFHQPGSVLDARGRRSPYSGRLCFPEGYALLCP